MLRLTYADRHRLKINTTAEDPFMMRSFSFAGIALCAVFHWTSAAAVSAQEKTPDRWEKEIAAIEEQIASGKTPQEGVLFVGSSSIRLWKLDKSFPDLKTANHGFGGSQLEDSVRYFERIVVPAKPTVIVLYAGDNDVATGKSASDVSEDFREFVEKVEQQLPTCRRVLYVSIKPSLLRWNLAEKMKETNASIRKICESDDRLEFVDIWAPMLNEKGEPTAELFVKDGLHLSEAGYAVWTQAVRPYLAEQQNSQ
jgi:lysophospholipase L1-like esterase